MKGKLIDTLEQSYNIEKVEVKRQRLYKKKKKILAVAR